MQVSLRCFIDAVTQLGLPADSVESLESIYAPVAQWIVGLQDHKSCPVIIGVNGAQGSGKSTFCSLLAPLLSEVHGLRTVVLSIDDVYLTREARIELSRSVHPLCKIRGVPGTHDVAMAQEVLDRLTQGGCDSPVWVPRFDKAIDDRRPREDWDVIDGPVDVILFEGWCVGCIDLPDWSAPINDRELVDDPDGVWVRWSRQHLYADYVGLFERLDALVMLAVPSMNTVVEGRWLQEQDLWAACGVDGSHEHRPLGLMTRVEVEDYVALFERYTQHMLKTLPEQADVLISRRDESTYALEHISSENVRVYDPEVDG